MIGVLSREDVLNSQRMPGVNYKLTESIYGGDFFSKLKQFAGKAHDFLKKHKVISTVASAIPHPAAKAFGSVAHNLGYGMKQSKRGYGLSGGDLSGGKLTKEELKRRLKAPKDIVEEQEQQEESSESESE